MSRKCPKKTTLRSLPWSPWKAGAAAAILSRSRRASGPGRPSRSGSACRGKRPALRPSAAACAKKGRMVGGVGCPPNCRTSGKLRGNFGEARGSSDPFELFRKMLHFGKILKTIGQICRKFSNILANFARIILNSILLNFRQNVSGFFQNAAFF